MLFTTKGSYAVGYRLFNEKYYCKIFKDAGIVGAFACLHNKVSEFVYDPVSSVQGFAIKKDKFSHLLKHRMGQCFIPLIERSYRSVRKVINNHREMEARKSKMRLDYVSPKAFGVDVEAADLDYHREDCELIEKTVAKYCSKYGRLAD